MTSKGLLFYNFNYNKCATMRYNPPFVPVATSHAEVSYEPFTVPLRSSECPSQEISQKKSFGYNFIADAVEKAAPSVVYIEGTLQKRNSSGKQRQRKSNSISPRQENKVSGSGFVVCEDGIVLTSAHVVASVTNVKVTFPNEQKSYDAYVIDADQETDLAALKIITESEVKFPTAKLGKSADVRVGEWVAALGSPLGLSNTVTSGIVSTLDRQCSELGLEGKERYFIQTDTAINVGNSGGPLINLDGEVIGVSCIMIYPASGISFAVPSDIVSTFLEEAIKIEKSFTHGGEATKKYPKGERYFIGISMLTLTPTLLSQLQAKKKETYDSIEAGVLVARVNTNSPADRCGLNTGDVIVSVNDVPIITSSDVFTEVQKGELMILKVQRGQKTLVLYVKPEIISRL